MRRIIVAALLLASFTAHAGIVSGGPQSASVDTPLNVTLPSAQRGAFGQVLATQDRPVVELSFNYSINPLFVTTTVANGGTVTNSNSKAVLQTSAANNGSATLASNAAIRYVPGQGVIARFTAVFSTCVANSQQEIGIGDLVDGFFFGCQGATFGLFRRQNSVDTFTAQTAWNGDLMNGAGGPVNPSRQTLDITKGNVYVVEFQWLGFGAIRFFVEEASSGQLQLVHTIRYANANTDPSIFNPTLPLRARAVNSGNAANLTLQTASMGAYAEGPESLVGSNGSTGNSKSVTTEVALLSIRNNTTFQSKTNRVRVKILYATLSSTTGVDAIFRILLNTTLGGAPSFTDFDTNTSVVAIDTAGTTVTGGRELFRARADANLSTDKVLDVLQIRLNPGDVLTVTGTTTAGAVTTQVDIQWREEFGG